MGAGVTSGSLPPGFRPRTALTCGLTGERKLGHRRRRFTVSTTPPYLLLVDAGRWAVRPRLPEGPCGDPRAEVLAAIRGLALTETERYTVDATYQGR